MRRITKVNNEICIMPIDFSKKLFSKFCFKYKNISNNKTYIKFLFIKIDEMINFKFGRN